MAVNEERKNEKMVEEMPIAKTEKDNKENKQRKNIEGRRA